MSGGWACAVGRGAVLLPYSKASGNRAARLLVRRLFCRGSLPASADRDSSANSSHVAAVPHLVVVGAGAAGVFGAIRAKELCGDKLHVTVVEKSQPLSKVRISGGGRCNVTTGISTDPMVPAAEYPRGHKELRGAFFRKHGPQDTMAWFQDRGVQLKREADGRVFPVSDSSQTIISCLLEEAKRLGVRIRTGWPVGSVAHSILDSRAPGCGPVAPSSPYQGTSHSPEGLRLGPVFRVVTSKKIAGVDGLIAAAAAAAATLEADFLLLATGSSTKPGI